MVRQHQSPILRKFNPSRRGSMMRLYDRIWTPPRLQAIRFQAVRYDCSRISGLVLLHLLQALDPDGLFAR